jgi:hypothetical protein
VAVSPTLSRPSGTTGDRLDELSTKPSLKRMSLDTVVAADVLPTRDASKPAPYGGALCQLTLSCGEKTSSGCSASVNAAEKLRTSVGFDA